MIELGVEQAFDDAREIVEVDDHAGCRTTGLQRTLDGNVQQVRMSVEPRALSGVMREHVRRLERELFADLHGQRSFVF